MFVDVLNFLYCFIYKERVVGLFSVEALFKKVEKAKRDYENYFDEDEFERRKLLTVWKNSSFALVGQIQQRTFQARGAYFVCPQGSKPQNKALSKWINFSFQLVDRAKTLDQADEVWLESPIGSEPERLAFQKRVKFCTVPNDAKREWQESIPGSQESYEFLSRWIDLCDTLEDLDEALGKTHAGSVERKKAMVKMNGFRVQQVV